MKLSLLLLICFFCSLCTFSNTRPPGKYTVVLTVNDLKQGKIYLSSLYQDAGIKDSAVLKDGKATFTGIINEPHICYVAIPGALSRLVFFLEKGTITITGVKDSLKNSIVAGSSNSAAYREWQNEWNRMTAPTDAAYKRGYAAGNGNSKNIPDSLKKEMDYQHSLLPPLTVKAMERFLKKYPELSVSAYLIKERYIDWPDKEMVEKMAALLGKTAINSYYGKQVAAFREVNSRTAIGSMPTFFMADTSGKVINVGDYKGRYVLVDFWASWCGPCRKENPAVLKAYNQFHKNGFEVLGVSLDDKKQLWLNAIREDKLPWQQVSDLQGAKGEVVLRYGVTIIPTNFLLDKEGKVIAKDLRGEALYKKLEEILN